MNDELSQANSRGFVLGRRHAALADVIGQAALWARFFGVSTAEVLPDGSVFMTYRLTQHADYLMELWRLLGGACVNLASSFEGRMSAQDVSVTPLSYGAAIQSPTCREWIYRLKIFSPSERVKVVGVEKRKHRHADGEYVPVLDEQCSCG